MKSPDHWNAIKDNDRNPRPIVTNTPVGSQMHVTVQNR